MQTCKYVKRTQSPILLSAINNMWFQNQPVTFLFRRLTSFAQDICLIIGNVDSLFDMKISVFRILVKLGCITVPKYCCFITVILLLLWTICQQVTRITIVLLYCCTRKRNCTAVTWTICLNRLLTGLMYSSPESIRDLHHVIKRERGMFTES